MTVTAAPTLPFAGALGEAHPGEPAWLATLRSAARERFAAVGLPTSRDEEWRFTPVGPLAKLDIGLPAAAGAVSTEAIAPCDFDPAWPLLVVVDGRIDATRSRLPALPGGARLMALSEAIAAGVPEVEAHLTRTVPPEATPFAALNAAAFTDGLFLLVPRGCSLEQPIQVLHVATDASADALLAPRVLVVVGDEARATITESYLSLTERTHVTAAVAEIVVGRNATVEHIRVQRENEAAWHVGFTAVDQGRDSHYRSFALSMGAHLARHNLHAHLGDENIETLLYGLSLTRGEQLSDTHSAIHHDHPNCNSWEVYKGVLDDRSRIVFNGKVLVDPIAQKTDAKQTNRNLLLSEQARVDTKPQLEIFADDVRCTHGATIGKLNEQQRYYLQSRGIAGAQAEQLLVWAFAAEVMLEILEPTVRKALESLVHARLGEMTG
jgi:Fe-S cluster assembly protein SufD